jgi:hypothetical protein
MPRRMLTAREHEAEVALSAVEVGGIGDGPAHDKGVAERIHSPLALRTGLWFRATFGRLVAFDQNAREMFLIQAFEVFGRLVLAVQAGMRTFVGVKSLEEAIDALELRWSKASDVLRGTSATVEQDQRALGCFPGSICLVLTPSAHFWNRAEHRCNRQQLHLKIPAWAASPSYFSAPNTVFASS